MKKRLLAPTIALNALVLTIFMYAAPPSPYHVIPSPPASAQTLFEEAQKLQREQKHTQALQKYKEALTRDPHHFEAHFNCGVQLFRQKKDAKAQHHFTKALECNGSCAQAHFNLGLIAVNKKDINTALKHFAQAVSINPRYEKAYGFLGSLHHKKNNLDDALYNYTKAAAINSNNFETQIGTARVLRAAEKIDQALTSYNKAVALRPHDINALFEYSYLLTTEGQFELAIDQYKKILELDPNCADVLCNTAHTYRYMGEAEKAIPYYQKALKRYPEQAPIHYGLGEAYLTTGNFEDGWQEFNWRWRRAADTRKFGEKQWDGSDPKGKTIILRAEYGQGDTLQFVRYAQLLKERGATVIVEAQHTLVSLLSLCPYIDKVIVVNDPVGLLPEHDAQIPLMSMPHVFKTTLDTVPTNIPYIEASPALIETWKEQLAPDTNFKIGICWAGSPYYESFKSSRSRKSVPLELFAQLAQLSGVTVYSLQKMNDTEQLNNLPRHITIHDFGPNFDMDNGRFMDTAAVIQNLDLVITVDTSIAHLAGALGKPVFVMLPFVSDWRWMRDRNDSPWYPTMRLFRQQTPGDWHSVMQEIISALPIQKISGSIAVSAEVSVGELIDKITILHIKSERIFDEKKLHNINTELVSLLTTQQANVPSSQELDELTQQLKETNEKLWVIEDDIRDKEREQCFDQVFIQLARNVYYTNDKRCRIKKEINILLGSHLVEEKGYSEYQPQTA